MIFRFRGRPLVCALVFVACAQEPGSTVPVAQNVLLVTFDTTRWDAIDGFGSRTGITPNLARLAQEGVRYRWARTVAPITLPAHASIFTGLYPLRHGVRANGAQPLPPAAVTLAERTRDAGFDTAAFVAAIVLDRQFGLDQGFDRYDQPEQQAVSKFFHGGEHQAGRVTNAAIEWLRERNPERRFFLWLHYFDPHLPYDLPTKFDRTPEADDRPGEHAYLGEVAQADAALGQMFDALRAEGLYDETAIVVVADHAEGLWDHGEESHAALCYDSTLRVPLVLRSPDGFRAGEASDEIVSVVDLYPTLLGLLGLPPDEDVDGIDLLDGPIPEDRGVYFESYYGFQNFGWSPLVGWARRGSKYLRASEEVVFDPEQDPLEEHPLHDSGDVMREARENINRLAALPTLSGGVRVDADVVARLALLGYATGEVEAHELPHPLAPSELPNPMESMEEFDRMNRADALLSAGRDEDGIELLGEILRANPRNAYVQQNLATALDRAGRTAEAVTAWENLIELGDASVSTQLSLAHSLAREGDRERASVLLEGILSQDPGNRDARRQLLRLAVMAERAGDLDQMRAYRRLLQQRRGDEPAR